MLGCCSGKENDDIRWPVCTLRRLPAPFAGCLQEKITEDTDVLTFLSFGGINGRGRFAQFWRKIASGESDLSRPLDSIREARLAEVNRL